MELKVSLSGSLPVAKTTGIHYMELKDSPTLGDLYNTILANPLHGVERTLLQYSITPASVGESITWS